MCSFKLGAVAPSHFFLAWVAQANQSSDFLVCGHHDRKRVVLQKWLFWFVIQAR